MTQELDRNPMDLGRNYSRVGQRPNIAYPL